MIDLIDNHARSLWKRALMAAYRSEARRGAYWGVVTDIGRYPYTDPLPCPHDVTLWLATVPTRLAATDDTLQEQLI